MSTFDLSTINKQPSLTEPEKAISPDDVNKDKPKEETTPDEEMIVLDGPLSSIYTKALNLVYSNTNKATPSTETESMDVYVEAATLVGLGNTTDEEKDKYINSTYAYVTDCSSINSGSDVGGAVKAFECLTDLNEKKIFKNIVVCIEGSEFSNKTFILEDYLNKSGITVYHTRSAMLSRLTK